MVEYLIVFSEAECYWKRRYLFGYWNEYQGSFSYYSEVDNETLERGSFSASSPSLCTAPSRYVSVKVSLVAPDTRR